MADDPLIAFTKKLGKAAASSPAAPPKPTFLPSLSAVHESVGSRQLYEPFENKVRATSVQVRNHRTEIAHAVQYAHMSTIDFSFVRGDWLAFSADGYGYRIEGRNLGDVFMALDLRTCGVLQDYHPGFFVLPEPLDPKAPFISRIDVVVLRPVPQREASAAAPKAK